MRATVCLLAALTFGPVLEAESRADRQAPSYSAASIVNAASNRSAELSPNTFGTIYGTGLAYVERPRAIGPSDMSGAALPTILSGTGVRVLVGNYPANIYYVSPTQINFLVPAHLLPGAVNVELTIDGKAGPSVAMKLLDHSPALFQWAGNVVAARADGSVVDANSPAVPGEDIVLYATGLGRTAPDAEYGRLAPGPAPIRSLPDFQILLSGAPVERSLVAYVGLTPGFAGLYQINFRIPAKLPADPEIRIAIGSRVSPEGLRLPLRIAGI